MSWDWMTDEFEIPMHIVKLWGPQRISVGFCLKDPRTAKAIRERDPCIFDQLNDLLCNWDERCAIWNLTETEMYVSQGPGLGLKAAGEIASGLSLIIHGGLADKGIKRRAHKLLIDVMIFSGQGWEIPSGQVKVDYTRANKILVESDYSPLRFYMTKKHFPQSTSGGIYLLWRESVLEYVGETINLRKRFYRHKVNEDGNHLIGVSFSNKSKANLQRTEEKLIRGLHPLVNIQRRGA